MSTGNFGYRFIRRLEARLQGTVAGKLGMVGYRIIRQLRVKLRRRALTREYGRSALPLIRADTLLGTDSYTLSHYTFAPWGASPMEYVLIQGIARRIKPCHFFEIGSLRGELLANLNGLVESAVSLSLSKEEMRNRGYPNAAVDTNLLYAGDAENLSVIYADSRNYDFSKLPSPRPNLVFVDGDHAYEMVKHDTANVLSICAEESVIVWHDYSLADHMTVHWPVFAGILDGLPKKLWSRLYHVNNTVCAVLLPESWPVRLHEHPLYPERVYSMTLCANETAARLPSNISSAVGET